MKIIVGWTPDEVGEAVLAQSITEAGLRGGDVTVVAYLADHVSGPAHVEDVQLDALAAAYADAGVTAEVRPASADAASVVLDLASAADVGAIVIGTRGRSAVRKMVMGSVVQQIVADATVPVIVVRPAR